MGFFDPTGRSITSVLLRHLGRQTFQLEEPFVYRRRTGEEFVVLPEDLPDTDLASVPWFLGWFIPRYGRHTLPALLHDWHYRTGIVSRDEADDILSESLADTGVPLVRRRLMTAAVVLISRSTQRLRQVAIWAWFALFALGTLAVANAIFGWWQPSWWRWWFGLLAAAAPIAGAALWGRDWRLGLWGGYGILIVGPPSAVIMVAQGLYWLVEKLIPGGGEPIGTDEL